MFFSHKSEEEEEEDEEEDEEEEEDEGACYPKWVVLLLDTK